MASSSAFIFTALMASCSSPSAASKNLRGGTSFPTSSISLEEVQRGLLQEINEALGVAPSDGHLEAIEAELDPIFTALPKASGGFLSHTGVRYALHRFFVQKHGWYFRGLEPSGSTMNSEPASMLLKDRVPSYIQSLIEEQLEGRGFSLRELTVFAASLEHLVSNEAADRLKASYETLGMNVDEMQPEAKVDQALNAFMMDFVLGDNFDANGPNDVSDVYPQWEKIQEFLHEVRRNVSAKEVLDGKQMLGKTRMDFSFTAQVVAEIGRQIGHWHGTQCRSLKEQLLSLGDRQAGRIPLSSFYTAALKGTVRGEHIDYLRELGSLDESVASKPSVVVANYINSPTNCIASSSFYSVCCMNECETMLRHIEQSLTVPFAEPAQIEKLVASLPSSTVSAPRELPAQLRERLQQIAKQHDGEVPLHGRLFSQWLHHAYPRECPYPHVSGSIHPQTADEWMADTGRQSSSTRDEMLQFVNTADGGFENVEGVLVEETWELPWSDDEELLVIKPALPSSEEPGKTQALGKIFRGIFFALALISMLWMVQEHLRKAVRDVCEATHKGLPMKCTD